MENNGGVPDAVIDGETGILVDMSRSHEPLAEAMESLPANPALVRNPGMAGQQRVLQEFDCSRIGLGFAEWLSAIQCPPFC